MSMITDEHLDARWLKANRGKLRGEAFVGLYAAAKQLVDNYPKRFPYLEWWTRKIEWQRLAPPLERK